MDMHKNFAEWYRLVSIEPRGDVLKSRWAGVETWSVSLSDDAVLETVRIFQGLPEVTSREAFLAAFRKHDPAFPQRNNELEQRVLAGAVLIRVLSGAEDDDARTPILAGVALAASRLRVADGPLAEMSMEVLSPLEELARSQRRRKGFDSTLLSSEEENREQTERQLRHVLEDRAVEMRRSEEHEARISAELAEFEAALAALDAEAQS